MNIIYISIHEFLYEQKSEYVRISMHTCTQIYVFEYKYMYIAN